MAQETVEVEIEGLGTVRFPASMTDEQIMAEVSKIPRTAFRSGRMPDEDAASSARRSAPDAPADAEDTPIARNLRSFGQSVVSGLNPLPLMARMGQAVVDPRGPNAGFGDMAIDMGRGIAASHADTGRRAMSQIRRVMDPNASTTERLVAAPSALGLSAATAIPVLGPMAAHAGERIGSGDVGGGLGEAALLLGGPAIGRATSRAMSGVGREMAKTTLNTADDAVAAAALRQRAMPGLIRRGPSKVERRVGQAMQEAQGEISRAGASGAPMRIGRRNIDQAMDRLNRPFSGRADVASARDIAQEVADYRRTAPTVGDALSRSEATRRAASADAGPRGMMGRATAADTRAGVARAVPGAEPALRRIDDLDRVSEAYAARPHNVIDQAGLPTMPMRLLASTIDRSFGPGAQLLHSASRPTDAMIRASIVENLLRGGTPEALPSPR